MKIRFRKNTIRYRLDKIDIKELVEKGFCQERTTIPPKNLTFSLVISDDDTENIFFEPSQLKLEVPLELITPILDESEVGFERRLQGIDDSIIEVLVEKDFKCLAPRERDDANAFENPLADHST